MLIGAVVEFPDWGVGGGVRRWVSLSLSPGEAGVDSIWIRGQRSSIPSQHIGFYGV